MTKIGLILRQGFRAGTGILQTGRQSSTIMKILILGGKIMIQVVVSLIFPTFLAIYGMESVIFSVILEIGLAIFGISLTSGGIG